MELKLDFGKVRGSFDLRRVQERIERLAFRFLTNVGLEGEVECKKNMLVDTGFARASVGYQVRGDKVAFGIITPKWRDERLMTYPARQEIGIKRQLLYVRDRSGNIRMSVVKWLERHGFSVWKTSKGKRVLRITAIPVWGYRHPWLSNAQAAVQAKIPSILDRLRGGL